MKKATAIMAAVLMPLVCLALDANQMHYVEILSAQAPTLEKTDLLLLGPTVTTNGTGAAGSTVTATTYEGYGVIVMQHSARGEAGNTNIVSVFYGYADPPTTALIASTQTTATAKYDSYEFDFDTLQGTNAALYLKATCTNLHGVVASSQGAVLIYEAARSAAQTNTSSIIDVSAYKGNATMLYAMGAPINESAAYTNIVTLQHGTNSAFAGVSATITNLAGTAGVKTFAGTTAEVSEFAIDLGRLHQYVRAVSVAQHDAGSVGVILVAPQKSE